MAVRPAALILLSALAGCAVPERAPPVVAPPPPLYQRPLPQQGLDRVMGQTAAALVRLFGAADLDVREASSRKLQFGSGICVLDAYLYPLQPGREPVVTHIDARDLQGRDFDRASCIAALARRDAAQPPN